MNRTRASRNVWLLPVSIVAALLLGLLPLPESLQPFRPYWLGLVVAYWIIEGDGGVGLGFAFAVGLIADLAFGSLMGEHALRLTIMVFILQRFRTRLRFFPMPQQALIVGALLLNDRIVSAVVHMMFGLPALPWTWWLGCVLGMLLWVPLYLMLETLRYSRRKP